MLKNFIRLSSNHVLQHRKIVPRYYKVINIQSFASEAKNLDQSDETTQKTKHNPFAQPSPLGSQVEVETLDAAEREKRLKVLQLEADIAHQEGRRVPALDFFQDHHWEHILTLPTKSARGKYYAFLWQIEMKKEGEKRRKLERAEANEIRKEELKKDREENNHIIYGLGHCSLFLRVYDTTINHWQNNRLIRAMQFSPKIVLDCSYDSHMNKREATNAAKQLMLCFAENRFNDDPFDLHYCNVNTKSVCTQTLKRFIPTMYNPEFPINIHSKCFTELFPRDNLVYLTPHCRHDLTVYNPDDIYIIGAMVDTVNNEPLSLAKAKRLGLRMARLPLDRYLQWGSGSGKSLTLNQMVNIMLDLKNTGDWQKALQHVPRRKVVDVEIDQQRQRKFLKNRADRLNLRLDQIFNAADDGSDKRRKATAYGSPEKLRSRKEGMQFKLDTWGSGKKSRSQSN